MKTHKIFLATIVAILMFAFTAKAQDVKLFNQLTCPLTVKITYDCGAVITVTLPPGVPVGPIPNPCSPAAPVTKYEVSDGTNTYTVTPPSTTPVLLCGGGHIDAGLNSTYDLYIYPNW